MGRGKLTTVECSMGDVKTSWREPELCASCAAGHCSLRCPPPAQPSMQEDYISHNLMHIASLVHRLPAEAPDLESVLHGGGSIEDGCHAAPGGVPGHLLRHEVLPSIQQRHLLNIPKLKGAVVAALQIEGTEGGEGGEGKGRGGEKSKA